LTLSFISGRPNVGKSTLFNRLTRTRKAIVTKIPGTTRDRREEWANFAGLDFSVVDTGGLEDATMGSLEHKMLAQTKQALGTADVIFFMLDIRAGVTAVDYHFARWLRKEAAIANKAVHLIANKAEGDGPNSDGWEAELNEFYRLGFGDPVLLSAEHGEGMSELVDLLLPHQEQFEQEAEEILAIQAAAESIGTHEGQELQEGKEDEGQDDDAIQRQRPIQMAIVGRPNAGKSTLVNALLQEERVITGDKPGLTRDSIAVDWEYNGFKIKLVDTAGIRRHARRDTSDPLENLAVQDAMRAIGLAQVVALVVDMEEGHLTRTELAIAGAVVEQGRALVVVANKVDLFEDNDGPGTTAKGLAETLEKTLDMQLSQAQGVPIVPISAIRGEQGGINRVMPAVIDAHKRWRTRVGTGRANQWLKELLRIRRPPSVGGRPVKLKYVTQIKSGPPTFQLFTNHAGGGLSTGYLRFVTNQLRAEFGFAGVPLRITVKGGDSHGSNQQSLRGKGGSEASRGGRGGGGRGGGKGKKSKGQGGRKFTGGRGKGKGNSQPNGRRTWS
jgi:GTP-binding protein